MLNYFPFFKRILTVNSIMFFLLLSFSSYAKKKDYSRLALEKLQKMAKDGIPAAQVKLGKVYYDGTDNIPQDYNLAFNCFRKAAKNNSLEGYYNLGICYETGNGVKKDFEKAIKNYKKVADNGVVVAQVNLGRLLESLGRLEEAMIYYKKSAYKKNTFAMYKYGKALLEGKLLKQNKALGFNMIKDVAANGDINAQFIIADCYKNGVGVRRDYRAMLNYLLLAADTNNPEAQTKIGICYDIGMGVPKDTLLATKWYKKASKQAFPLAQLNLGVSYILGRGVGQDSQKAFNLFLKASKSGLTDAYFNLAVCYSLGRGIPKNEAKAFSLFTKAANAGHLKSQCNLGMLYEDGVGVVQDKTMAFYWYKKAADREEHLAEFKVGMYYLFGKGIEKNFKNAKKYLLRASNGGIKDAKSALNKYFR